MYMLRAISTGSVLLLVNCFLVGQCGLTVDAGPDIITCPGQGPISLNGSISANAFGFAWEESATLNDQRSLSPTVDPTVTTDYVLVAYTADPADNLVVNGDFEQGNVGFTSEYDFEPGGGNGPITPDGSYSITTNSNDAHDLFNPCSDNSGSGNMMACNGSTQSDLKVWCQTVNIVPNTTYVLRAYIASIWTVGEAELQFSVNNDLVGPIFQPTLNPPCTYDFFDERWSSDGGETTAEICVVNQTTIFFGYNFSIDDIFFAPVCEQYDTVRVEVVDTEITVDDEYDLPCGFDPTGFAISALGATSPGYSYQWATSNGSIVSGANQATVLVDAPGAYTVTLSYADGTNNCSTMRTVNVTMNQQPPDLLLESDGDLNCIRDFATISSDNSTISVGSTYSWTSLDGSILSSTTEESITVDAPGTYTLTVITGGCSDTEDFLLIDDLRTPDALIEPAEDLSCTSPIISLDASNTVLGPDDIFYWTTDNGTFTGDLNTLTPTVVEAGNYLLVVENEVTGCFDIASVQVGGSGEQAVAMIDEPPLVNCQGDPVSLTSTGSSTGSGVSYQWTTTNGTFDGPSDGQTVQVTTAGEYELIVTQANGCEDRANVTVQQEGFSPQISFLSTQPITCDRALVTITGEVVTTENVTYQWTTIDGEIQSGATTLSPQVTSGGTYRLIVTEPIEGCSVSSVITVPEDLTPPVALTANSAVLTCTNPDVLLSTTGSSSGPNISFTWQDESANPVQDSVNTPGTYQLRVRNADNGCTAFDTLTVSIDTLSPLISLAAPATSLTCTEDTLLLAEASPNPAFSYHWNGPEGNVAGSQISVGTPGQYILTAIDTLNGCASFDSVLLNRDQDLPIISITPPLTLTCDRTFVPLVAEVANPDGFDLSWSTTGNIFFGDNTLNPSVDEPGTYQLTLLNPATGCTDSLAVSVSANTILPVATIAPADTITCLNEIVGLDASSSTSGDSITYVWTSLSGNFSGPLDSVVANATTAGTYLLTVRNRITGCLDRDTIGVVENGVLPVIDLPEALTLSCQQPSLTLNEGATAETGLIYNWLNQTEATTISGLPSVAVTAPGQYALRIENIENGCFATDSVLVGIDTIAPEAIIEPAEELNCTVLSLPLTSLGTAQAGATYTWSTNNGSFLQNGDAPESRINAAGIYTLRITNQNGCSDSTDVVIGIDTLRPVITFPTLESLSCRIREQVVLAQISQDQGANISYQWSSQDGMLDGSSTAPSITVEQSGTFVLMVTNTANNCQQSGTVVVEIDTIHPVLAELPDSIILSCSTPSTTFNEGAAVEDGLVYNWVNTTNTTVLSDLPSLSVETAGQYLLTVENAANGCISMDSIAVGMDTISPIAMIAPVDELNCSVFELILNAVGATLPGATYSWTTDDGSFTQNSNTPESTINTAGTYALLVSNPNGCQASTTVTVNSDTLKPLIVLPEVNTLTCEDPEQTILSIVTQDQEAAISYQWSQQDGTANGTAPSLIVNQAGTYNLLVTNEANTCQQSAEISIAIDTLRPILDDLPSTVINCDILEAQPNPVILSGRQEVEYSWATLSGPSIPEQTPTPTVSTSGTFALTVIDPINGCSSTKSWTVIQDTLSPLVNLPATLDLGCDTLPVTVSAETDPLQQYLFAWSTEAGTILAGQSAATVELMGPAAYSLSVENPTNGCQTTKNINLTQTLLEGFDFELLPPNCAQETGTLSFVEVAGGIGPFVYSIDNGQAYSPNQIYGGLEPGNYNLTVQDIRGCEAANSVSIPPVRNLEIGLTDNLSLLQGDSIQLDLVMNFAPFEIDTIIWFAGAGLSCYDCTQPTARPLASTTYEVEVVSQDGCRARTRVQILVDERGLIYVPNAFSPNGDGVNDFLAPLAASHRVNRVLQFAVFDRWGNQVYQSSELPLDGSGGGWDGTHRNAPLNVGTYVWSTEVEMVDLRVVRLAGEVMILR